MYALFIIGRILLGGYFIYNGVSHFIQLESLAGYARSKNVPAPKFAVGLTGIMLLIGGLSILLNMYMREGMIILAIFMIGVTAMMHPFWVVKDPAARMNEQIGFMKNLAILGALLMMIA